jgi:hypothetical protein
VLIASSMRHSDVPDHLANDTCSVQCSHPTPRPGGMHLHAGRRMEGADCTIQPQKLVGKGDGCTSTKLHHRAVFAAAQLLPGRTATFTAAAKIPAQPTQPHKRQCHFGCHPHDTPSRTTSSHLNSNRGEEGRGTPSSWGRLDRCTVQSCVCAQHTSEDNGGQLSQHPKLPHNLNSNSNQ